MSNLKSDISQHARSSTDENTFVELYGDELSNSQIVIETDHARIHAGLGFDFSDYIIGLADQASRYFLIKPLTAGVHLRRLNVRSSRTPVIIELFKNPSGTADGTEQPAGINRNQYSTITSPLRIYYDPTVTAEGTRMRVDAVLDGIISGGESDGLGLEWVLKANTVYLLKITNNAGLQINYGLDLFWYHVSPPTP